jgi:hypothetical protein
MGEGGGAVKGFFSYNNSIEEEEEKKGRLR